LTTIERLDHPNIVKIYDMYKDNDSLYIVSEFLEGGSLFQRITIDGFKYKEEHIAEIIHRLLLVIKDLSKVKLGLKMEGVVHKQIRMRNVFFDSKGQPKLTNFGVSDSDVLSKVSKASVHEIVFSWPEVITLKKFSSLSDIWAIAVLAYTLLVGYRPFEAKDTQETISNMKKGEIHFYPADWK